MKRQYRNLTATEVEQLERQGNCAGNWMSVMVTDVFDASCLRNNNFEGDIRLGDISSRRVDKGNMPLHEGIYNSSLVNCTVGDRPLIRNVQMLCGYTIGNDVTLQNIDEMSCTADPHRLAWMEPMNENGGRRLLPFPGMTVGEAYLWARYRGCKPLMERLEQFTYARLATDEGRYGQVGDSCSVVNTKTIRNVALLSTAADPTIIDNCIALCDGVVNTGCTLEHGVIARRFLLGEHVHLEFGLRLNDTVVGDNSTLARCEVAGSIIFPAHEQHHNNSFLIAALIMGQSNVAAGGTIGSNHNSRTADGEIAAGRGFWPGLCCSFKHSSRFASYCLLAKADYPAELDIKLPFALVNNNTSKDQLEVMPAYWWMYNMYALDRNSKKFAKRDKRVVKAQHIEFDLLAPDTAEEMLQAVALLQGWIEASSDGIVRADGMEKSSRPTVILKAREGIEAYRQMLLCYAMQRLTAAYGSSLPPATLASDSRIQHWVNIGGQIIPADDIQTLITDVQEGRIGDWKAVRERFVRLAEDYATEVTKHAYGLLSALVGASVIDADLWQAALDRYEEIKNYIEQQKAASRHKDDVNTFRRMTYWDDAERAAVLG